MINFVVGNLRLFRISWFQHVVTSFIECQQQALDRISELEMDKQQALSRVTHLEEEIKSHKAHIATLKNELAAACRRPMSDDGLSEPGHYIPGVVTFLTLSLLFRVLVDRCLYLSKQCIYPSPDPTLTLSRYQSIDVGLGEG